MGQSASTDIPRAQRIASMLSKDIGKGFEQVNLTAARIPALVTEAAQIVPNVALKAAGQPQMRSPEWMRNNAITKTIEDRIAKYDEVNPVESFEEAVISKDPKRIAVSVGRQIVQSAPQQVAIVGMALAGNPEVGLVGMSAGSGGQKLEEAYRSGADPVSAQIDAVLTSLAEYYPEKFGLGSIFDSVEKSLITNFGNKGARQLLTEGMKVIVGSGVKEGVSGATTEGAQQLADVVTGVDPNALQKSGTKMLGAGLVGAGTGIGITAPGAVMVAGQSAQVKALKDRRVQDIVNQHMQGGAEAQSERFESIYSRVPELEAVMPASEAMPDNPIHATLTGLGVNLKPDGAAASPEEMTQNVSGVKAVIATLSDIPGVSIARLQKIQDLLLLPENLVALDASGIQAALRAAESFKAQGGEQTSPQVEQIEQAILNDPAATPEDKAEAQALLAPMKAQEQALMADPRLTPEASMARIQELEAKNHDLTGPDGVVVRNAEPLTADEVAEIEQLKTNLATGQVKINPAQVAAQARQQVGEYFKKKEKKARKSIKKYVFKHTPEQKQSFSAVIREIKNLDRAFRAFNWSDDPHTGPSKYGVTQAPQGTVVSQRASYNTNPDHFWMKSLNIKHAEDVRLLEKAIKGMPLTEQQKNRVEELANAYDAEMEDAIEQSKLAEQAEREAQSDVEESRREEIIRSGEEAAESGIETAEDGDISFDTAKFKKERKATDLIRPETVQGGGVQLDFGGPRSMPELALKPKVRQITDLLSDFKKKDQGQGEMKFKKASSFLDSIKSAGIEILEVKPLEDSGGYFLVKMPSSHIVLKETNSEYVIEGVGRNNRGMSRDNRGIPTKAIKAIVLRAMSEGKSVKALSTDGAIPFWSGNLGFRKEGHNHIMDSIQFDKIKSGEIKVYGWGEFNDYNMQPWTDLPPLFKQLSPKIQADMERVQDGLLKGLNKLSADFIKEFMPEVRLLKFAKIVTPDGKPAVGAYVNGKIILTIEADGTVGPHEVIHAFLDMFVDPKRKRELLESAKKVWGVKTDLEAEEALADALWSYIQAKREGRSGDTIFGAELPNDIKYLFTRIWKAIKAFFDRRHRTAIKQLYDDILAKKRPERTYRNLMNEAKFKSPNKGGYTKAGQGFTHTYTNDELRAKFGKTLGGIEYARGIKLPELVELAKAMASGKTPMVGKLRSALGYMYGSGKGSIALDYRLFADPGLAEIVLAHEIGHLADYLPDYTLKRGNLLGRIASMREYLKHTLPMEPGMTRNPLTDKDRARLKKAAEELFQTQENGELFKNSPQNQFDPDAILAIWNAATTETTEPALLEYIKRLSAAEKKSIIKASMEAKRSGESITLDDVYKFNADVKADKKTVAEFYKDLIQKEIAKRQMYSIETIRAELRALTEYWRPFEDDGSSYAKTRYSGKELYADFMSVLLNAPGKVKEIAPNTFQAFFNWLDKKPEVKSLYFDIQTRLLNPAAVDARRAERLTEGFEDSRSKFNQLLQVKAGKDKSVAFMLKFHLVDVNEAALDIRRKYKGQINPENDPKYLLDSKDYIGSIVKGHLAEFDPIYRAILKDGLDFDKDLGAYLFHKRVINDRANVANPHGFTPETSQSQLDYMERRLGAAKYALLEGHVKSMRTWFKKIQNLMAQDIYTPEQIRVINENNEYAPFRVVEHLEAYASAGMARQIGTLKEIENPASSMLLKAIAMIRASERNKITKATARFLLAQGGVKEAKVSMVPSGKDIMPKVAHEPGFEPVMWREGGRWKAIYADPYMAESFKYGTSQEIIDTQRVLTNIFKNPAFKKLFIDYNPGWVVMNLGRDFMRFYKGVPKMTFLKAIKAYAQAYPAAYARAAEKIDPIVSQMEKEGVLTVTLASLQEGMVLNDETEIDAVLQQYGLTNPVNPKRNKLVKALMFIPDAVKFAGNVVENIPKIAAYQDLAKMNKTERAYFIRNYVGTPNFKRKGKATVLTNTLFMFSNIAIQGWRADAELGFKNPTTRAGWWWKTAKIGIVPKLIMLAAVAGLLGKDWEEIMNMASEYDKTNYFIVPLGFDEEGHGTYLRLPMDETTRFIAGIFWKMANGKAGSDVFDYTAGQLPGLTPLAGLALNWSIFMSGKNPRDWFRQQDVLTDDELRAGGMYAAKPMMAYTLNNMQNYYQFDLRDTVRNETLMQQLGRERVLIGRFIKTTDRGLVEKGRRTLDLVQRQEAKTRLDRTKQLVRAVNGKGKVSDLITGDKRKDAGLVRSAGRLLAKTSGSPVEKLITQATSNRQKMAVLDDAASAQDWDAYKKTVSTLLNKKLISQNVATAALSKKLQKMKGE